MHILKDMDNDLSVRLLDVDVTALQPALWKWSISERNFEVSHGYAPGRLTARIDHAMLRSQGCL
jgi:hypothetical protein